MFVGEVCLAAQYIDACQALSTPTPFQPQSCLILACILFRGRSGRQALCAVIDMGYYTALDHAAFSPVVDDVNMSCLVVVQLVVIRESG
jgi:hypothetical protein